MAQQNLKNIRSRSWQTLVYKISATDAEQFVKWDSIPVSRFENAAPVLSGLAESTDTDSLPAGHYVEIRVVDNMVQSWLFNNTNLHVLTINNKNNLQLDVRTKTGELQTTATAFLKGKPIPFNTSSKTFWLKQYQLDEAIVKICTPGDTTFIELAGLDDANRTLGEQRRQNYHYTKIYKILNWLPSKLKKILHPQQKYKSNRIGASGYIIFNQPKYKPLDTVKFKGYVVDKKLRQYNKPVEVYLNYYGRGKQVNQLVQILKPVSDGAYTGEFVLVDSIPSDVTCYLYFKTAKNKEIIRNSFKIEDYVLDEMGSFSFTANKETVYKNDSIVFTVSSKDANGLNVMDARATLIITTAAVNKFYKDTVFVADTLYTDEKKLLTTGDTKFSFDTKNLPAADLNLNAKLIFTNSNNELHEESESVSYLYETENLIVTQKGDSIKAILAVNGKSVTGSGELEMNDDLPKKVQFPYAAKIDPVAEGYTFYSANAVTGKNISSVLEIEDNYRIDFNRISKNDTLGFFITNPYQIPVYYTVLFGKQIITSGKSSNSNIIWQKKMNNHRHAYKVRWQYIWAGKEKQGEESIGLFYKLLDIKINSSETVFPGQKDEVKVTVKDCLGKPAANVNLTAVSYNNQFSKDISVPQPPYLAKYKSKKYLLREGFENDGEILLSKKYLLGKNKSWVEKFHLDSMLYYKLLFPANGFYDAVTLTENVLPQLSVNMVQRGQPQEIYLLLINRQLVYYNGVTDKMPYAFETMPENVKIGIRLKDKFIEIDSLYIQPHYKHDLSFDLDNLPEHSKVITAEKYWSYAEMNLLENSLWQMKNDYLNNESYVWQYNKLVKLTGSRPHIAGPFNAQWSMHFFNPNSFDQQFNFEPGYEYSLSKQIARLEKKAIFPRRDINNFLPNYESTLKLGDTLIDPPAIRFSATKPPPYLRVTKDAYNYLYYATKKNGTGRLQFTLPKDTAIRYIILQPHIENAAPLVLSNDHTFNNKVINLTSGKYNIYLVTAAFYIAAVENVTIQHNGTTCIKTEISFYKKENDFINQLIKKSSEAEFVVKEKVVVADSIFSQPEAVVFVTAGGASVTGKITDTKGGNPIAFASVKIKGTGTGVTSDATGNYSILRLRAGKHVLVIATVGYTTKEVTVEVNESNISVVNVYLSVSSQALNEVVVIGYGISRKKDLTGRVSRISENELSFGNSLQGKVAGVNIFNNNGSLGADAMIQIRGIGSFNADAEPIYVVDGIIYDKMPKNILPEQIAEVNVLKDAAAIAIYGARAVNGVIVITTKTKTFRNTFRDYAFWQPNFFTDKNGEASFEVTYPDNITGWRTFVVAMDKKRRIGKASVLTQSYKPIVAQLSVPQFLIENDSVAIIGKAINYTADKYKVSSLFNINGQQKNITAKELPGSESVIEEQLIAAGADTILASYSVTTATGFKDGEERKIPVVKKGTEEALGNFWVLQNDTTVNFSAAVNSNELNIYAQSNTLDVLLNEVEHLKQYPYYCMEQTASKLTGYAMEKNIKQQLGQTFKNEKELSRLLTKLQKAQQYDGGWAWWENGKTNFYITNYITTALQRFRENTLVETNVRNAFLYLQNQLQFLVREELLAALLTLSNGKHEMNYEDWLKRIKYDSLTQHQQWQWVQIGQQQKLNYQQQLKNLVSKKIETQLGGIHWGEENYSWYSNDIATTVIAFDVLKNEAAYKNLLPAVIQFFLERRKSGYWRNTVESALIVSTILPTVFEQNKNFTQPALLQFSGDTSFAVTQFPFELHKTSSNIKNITINKTGGGLVYITAYQKIFNEKPEPVNDKFIVQTSFFKNGEKVNSITSGEKIKMIISINVLKDANYVMLQVPIPAGCIYATKNNSDWHTYKEFYKDKMLLFTESLKKGNHQFEIELEPRYNGSYTLNPAKVELMYYPTFYGRNEMKKVAIVK
ncbi:carboxypeptidase-like regulatory domain-containing protein [Ferruginibacter sp.]